MAEERDLTPTEILMEAMDDFANSEPRAFLAMWTNEVNDVVMKTNTRTIECFGLLEYGRNLLIERQFRERR